MKKNSTLLCLVDNMDKPSIKLLDVYQLMDEIDEALEELFGDTDIEAPSSLVDKTLQRIQKEVLDD